MVSGGARAVARCDALGVAPYSDAPDMLFRAYLTPGYAATQARIAEWMAAAGMTTRIDAAGNLVGRYPGAAEAPSLVIGSHIDSVRDAGRYDGLLGVLLGIEAVASLGGRRLPFPIEIYAFGDEEGSRFPASMLTSRAVAGTLNPRDLEVHDADGVTLAHALERYFNDSAAQPHAMFGAKRARGSIRAYLEAHIEQGPVLETAGLPVGVVTGIAAQLRYAISVAGTAGHAGTTTMPLRHDALTAAAEMVLAVERIARDAGDVVATVGQLGVAPGAANVIPGDVTFTLDVRALDPARRDAAARAILATCPQIAERRGVYMWYKLVNDLPASPCDAALVALLGQAVTHAGVAPLHMPSGAGHDAMVMADLCPTAMLFIRCKGGVSHNPAEQVDPADADVALAVMLGFLDRLGADDAA